MSSSDVSAVVYIVTWWKACFPPSSSAVLSSAVCVICKIFLLLCLQAFQKLQNYTFLPTACSEASKLGACLSSLCLLINRKHTYFWIHTSDHLYWTHNLPAVMVRWGEPLTVATSQFKIISINLLNFAPAWECDLTISVANKLMSPLKL